MAAYPTVSMKTTITPLNDRKVEISDAGTVYQVDLAAAQVYQVDILHPLVSNTDRSTILAFWTANAGTTVTVAAGDGESYDCLMTNEPVVEVVNAQRSNVRVRMAGNRV